MDAMSERLNTPISTDELERRWAAVRAAMKEAGIQVLLMQNNNDHMGGYVKYFTDKPATNGYPQTVIFPLDDRMTMVGQGPFGMDVELPAEGDGVLRGVKRTLSTPSYESAPYTKNYDGELAAKALAPYAKAKVGLLGTYQMSYALVDYLKSGDFSDTEFVDASDMVDQIKVIKSEEELELIRGTALQQDAALGAAFEAIEPGMKDSDVAAVALHKGHNLGSEQGIYLCASGPLGTTIRNGDRHHQDRVIQDGDYFQLLVENNGAGGFFTEIGRTCVLGKASQELLDEFEFTLEAQQFTLDLLTPGRPSADVWNEFNGFMEKNGRPKENRLYCHGQGYDLVERPLVRMDEPMEIQANMNIVVHPGYSTKTISTWICDNYIIGADGPGECIHKYPKKIVEL
ncbi:MAG: M24 family metallopeptidase [Rhodospirillales bacterium]|jgi:Xaa-Pro aminopeptidase|nr:M24 family metallopeptidase [Rhodospirillales bacterium]